MGTKICIAIVFFCMLLLLWFLYEKPGVKKNDKKWLTWSSRKVPYFITNSPLASLLICYIIICLTIGLEISIEKIKLNSSTILICISIIGFIGTIIGLIVTYIQLKRNNNQFFGYDDFYRIAEELLSQKSKRKIRFHFTTPIPGHIAYNKDDEFKSFLYELKNYKGDIEFVIPDEITVVKMYKEYIGNAIGRQTTFDFDMIRKKLINHEGARESEEIDVRTFVNTLRKGDKVNVFEYSVADNEPEAIENLYLSDGRISIYAIPLHFLNIQDANKKNNEDNSVLNKPQLVGFVTTDRNLVSSLEENFEKIRDNSTVIHEKNNYLNEILVDNNLS